MIISSRYYALKEFLESQKCQTCRGSGKCDDLEPGDIGGNEWVCQTCKGIGLEHDLELKISGEKK